MIVTEEGYLAIQKKYSRHYTKPLTAKGKKMQETWKKKAVKDWFMVNINHKQSYILIQRTRIYLPPEYAGKRVRIKIEEKK